MASIGRTNGHSVHGYAHAWAIVLVTRNNQTTNIFMKIFALKLSNMGYSSYLNIYEHTLNGSNVQPVFTLCIAHCIAFGMKTASGKWQVWKQRMSESERRREREEEQLKRLTKT